VLVLVQQGQLIDQDGSERETSSVEQPLSGHLALPVEDALELPALKFSIALDLRARGKCA